MDKFLPIPKGSCKPREFSLVTIRYANAEIFCQAGQSNETEVPLQSFGPRMVTQHGGKANISLSRKAELC